MKQYKLIEVHRVKSKPEYVVNLDLVESDVDSILAYLKGDFKLVRLIVSPIDSDPFDDKTTYPDLNDIREKLKALLPKYYGKIELIGLPLCCAYPYHNDLAVSPVKPSLKFQGAWYSKYNKCKNCTFQDQCFGVPECYKIKWNKGVSPIRDEYQVIKDEWR